MRYLDPPAGADLYLAYSLHLAWGITPAANDRAILRILDRPRFEDLLTATTCSPEDRWR